MISRERSSWRERGAADRRAVRTSPQRPPPRGASARSPKGRGEDRTIPPTSRRARFRTEGRRRSAPPARAVCAALRCGRRGPPARTRASGPPGVGPRGSARPQNGRQCGSDARSAPQLFDGENPRRCGEARGSGASRVRCEGAEPARRRRPRPRARSGGAAAGALGVPAPPRSRRRDDRVCLVSTKGPKFAPLRRKVCAVGLAPRAPREALAGGPRRRPSRWEREAKKGGAQRRGNGAAARGEAQRRGNGAAARGGRAQQPGAWRKSGPTQKMCRKNRNRERRILASAARGEAKKFCDRRS